MWQSQSRRLNLASLVSANSSIVQSPIASKSPEILKAPCQHDWTSTGRLGAREFNQDAASSSQAWQKDAVLDESTRRLVASENADTKGKDNIWPHNLQISTDCVPHMEKDFSIVRESYGLSPRDRRENSRSERSYMLYIHVRHSSSCRSSWDILHGEFAFYQESVQEIIETVVSSDSEADH